MFYLRYGSGGTYQPKSDVRVVLVLVVAFISATQIMFKKQRRLNVLQGIKTTRTYSERLKTLTAEFASKGGKAARPASGSSKSKKDSKKEDDSEAKALAEAKLMEEIEPELPEEADYKSTLAF